MRSTGRWVKVMEESGGHSSIRMLHKDTRGRDCVRYKRQWWTAGWNKGWCYCIGCGARIMGMEDKK